MSQQILPILKAGVSSAKSPTIGVLQIMHMNVWEAGPLDSSLSDAGADADR